ncbi:carboxypeptidase regulatory-like domain-containing protein [Silvibacterium acidisoli]|uniref:carboxypeptidase regulatory-like domain-containing protein n=1 Tax=Acidobacteriaceae bacterium ZG23-2 TaxID=2883246 RepID=UPI00406CA1E9
MLDRLWRGFLAGSVAVTLSAGCTPSLFGQAGTQGTIAISVTDTSAAAISDAVLELTAVSTNTMRQSKTEGKGTFNFVGLPIGIYRLSISHPGFATTELAQIVVEASQTTPVAVVLKPGKATETVTVEAAATPLLDSTSNSLGSVIDMKGIESLPLTGRDLTALARLTPGYAGTTSIGVWNGQPLSNQGVNIDGVVGSASRGKYSGNAQAAASPRIENIAEMAVQTDQIDLDQGFGLSTMQISYVTRSGTNQFHGRLYVDSRNDGLNANTYANNAAGVRRTKLIYNDFGGSLGGPILHDQLFFFGSFSTRRVPGSTTQTNNYLTQAAQSGLYTYGGTTVNVFDLAAAAGQPTTPNTAVANQIALINKSIGSGGTIATGDPNIGQVRWNASQPTVYYWPTVRVDWNTTSKLHMYVSSNWSQETVTGEYPPPFPGSDFSNQNGGYHTRSITGGFGADYSITPSMINQLKLGYLYYTAAFANDIPPLYAQNPTIYWGFDSGGWGSYTMSGQTYTTPSSRFYPVMNVADSISWQKGDHSIKFGGSWNREQDHYYNNPAGFPNIVLGLAGGDPAANAFTTGTMPGASTSNIGEAKQLYAVLTGRVSSVYGQFPYSAKTGAYEQTIGSYNLDEVQGQWALFAQDSWRVSHTVTLNYGLRWDFTGDDHDVTHAYHSITPANLLGPSTSLFTPGTLGGNLNPTIDTIPRAYNGWNVAPEPQIGFAWNPSGDTFGKILGHGDTVIRGGFSLKRFTMPEQYFWNNASSYGSFFYQNFYLNANTTGTTGTFAPGSLSLGDSLPAYGLAPASYVQTEAQSDFTFLNSQTFAGMEKHIHQPYTESWNFGIERKFGKRAIEVRYDGNRTVHQWTPINLNEVNIFENGFLQQFKNAQQNLAASGGKTFKGSLPTPIFDAAFAGEAVGQYGHLDDYDNGQFTTVLQTGQVGSMANTLAGIGGTTTYFCNLVGASFAPCATNAGFSGTGAGYPINFFQANPYAAGQSTSLMTAAAYSNYNALQVDFRQQEWKGWTIDANYTYGKTLGVGSTNNYTGGADSLYTLRNFAKGYGPSPFDIKHTFHFTSTYDLPFGKGKMFLSNNSLLSSIVGNWTVGSIMSIMSGSATRLNGGNATYNDYADGGITLHGITAKQLQKAVEVKRVPGTGYATLLNPRYLGSPDGNDGANSSYIEPNTTPGTIGQIVYLYGPSGFYHDMSVSKSFPIRESVQFRVQGEFLNVWNHPVFGSIPGSFDPASNGGYYDSIQSTSFATANVTNTPRQIEIRANLEF